MCRGGCILAGIRRLRLLHFSLGSFGSGRLLHLGVGNSVSGIGYSLAHFKEHRLPLMLQNELFLYGQLLRPQRGGRGGVGQIGSRAGLLRGLGGSTHIGADGLFIVCHLKTSFVVK